MTRQTPVWWPFYSCRSQFRGQFLSLQVGWLARRPGWIRTPTRSTSLSSAAQGEAETPTLRSAVSSGQQLALLFVLAVVDWSDMYPLRPRLFICCLLATVFTVCLSVLPLPVHLSCRYRYDISVVVCACCHRLARICILSVHVCLFVVSWLPCFRFACRASHSVQPWRRYRYAHIKTRLFT